MWRARVILIPGRPSQKSHLYPTWNSDLLVVGQFFLQLFGQWALLSPARHNKNKKTKNRQQQKRFSDVLIITVSRWRTACCRPITSKSATSRHKIMPAGWIVSDTKTYVRIVSKRQRKGQITMYLCIKKKSQKTPLFHPRLSPNKLAAYRTATLSLIQNRPHIKFTRTQEKSKPKYTKVHRSIEWPAHPHTRLSVLANNGHTVQLVKLHAAGRLTHTLGSIQSAAPASAIHIYVPCSLNAWERHQNRLLPKQKQNKKHTQIISSHPPKGKTQWILFSLHLIPQDSIAITSEQES